MSRDPHRPSRREFVHAAAITVGGLAGIERLLPSFARTPWGRVAAEPTARQAAAFDLSIDRTTLDIGGRAAAAVTVNGSIPAPLLRFRDGDEVTIRVTNRLGEDTSIHWHGLLVPNPMDGVPQVTFRGILPGETFEYRFTARQSGTYWYHSHSGMQEQLGVYGPLIIDPAGPEPIRFDREHIIQLSDWTFENPHQVMARLKKMAGYYNHQRRTLVDFFRPGDAGLADRAMWGRMRMDPTDIADITGSTYVYLMNGRPRVSPWTGLFRPGERVRLRLINSGAATFFDVRIPGLPMTVVQADGQNVEPVTVDELRIAIAETYDVIVEPKDDRAYTVFAETMDRSGFALGTLAPREGMRAEVPPRRRRPLRSMTDMGMSMGGGAMAGMATMPGMDHSAHGALPRGAVPHGSDGHGPGNSMVPEITQPRLGDPGIGLGDDSRRVLVYRDLRSATPTSDEASADVDPDREITLHLTGNMERFMWSFDGKKFSDAPAPIPLGLGERVRITYVNDTMMEHPIHLHGMWMILENGQGERQPRKHTINVKPAERVSVIVTPDVSGPWALHCHVLYHMEAGMFRVVEVAAKGGA